MLAPACHQCRCHLLSGQGVAVSIFPFRIPQEMGLMAEPQALTHLWAAVLTRWRVPRSTAPPPVPLPVLCPLPGACPLLGKRPLVLQELAWAGWAPKALPVCLKGAY